MDTDRNYQFIELIYSIAQDIIIYNCNKTKLVTTNKNLENKA